MAIYFNDNEVTRIFSHIPSKGEFTAVYLGDKKVFQKDSDWRAVSFGNDRFVAIKNNSDGCKYSADNGATWTSSVLPTVRYWNEVKYVPFANCWLALGDWSSKVCRSADMGQTWSLTSLPSATDWHMVIGNNKVLAIASDGTNTYAHSTDGITWTKATFPTSAVRRRAVWTGTHFIVMTHAGNKCLRSTTGLSGSWIQVALPVSGDYDTIATNGAGIVVSPASWDDWAVVSTNHGSSWTKVTLPTYKNWIDIQYGNNMFMVITNNSDIILTSNAAGTVWSQRTLSQMTYWVSLGFGNGQFMALAENGQLARSTDGSTFTFSRI